MSLLSSIRSWIAGPQRPAPARIIETAPTVIIRESQPQARFESAFQYYGQRSLIPATLQDARFDYTPGIRRELQRRSRYWSRNDAIYERLVQLFEQYTVGPFGLRVLPDSSDKVYNALAKVDYEEWCQHPELDSEDDLVALLTLTARVWFTDGEAFLHLTNDPRTGEPAAQSIECHRVDTPSAIAEEEGGNVIDGIQIDPKTRRRLGYWVRKRDNTPMLGFANLLYPYVGNTKQEYDFVKAENMIHLFKRFRPGLQRGIPFMFSVGNDLHDLQDLLLEEMEVAKASGDLANIWHTKTGEPVDSSSFRQVPRTIHTSDSENNAVSKPSPMQYDVVAGARDRYLKIGEDVKQFATDRPSVATRELWDYLTFRVCAGMGISRLLVAPYAPAQGTVVRSDLDCNNTFFRSRSRNIARVAVKLWRYKMTWSLDWDRKFVGAPKDALKAKVRPIRSITADVGHNSEATCNEYDRGMRSLQNIAAEQGEDLEELMDARDQAYQMAVEKSKASGTPVEYLLPPPKQPAQPFGGKPPVPAPGAPPAKTNGNGNGHAVNRLELDLV